MTYLRWPSRTPAYTGRGCTAHLSRSKWLHRARPDTDPVPKAPNRPWARWGTEERWGNPGGVGGRGHGKPSKGFIVSYSPGKAGPPLTLPVNDHPLTKHGVFSHRLVTISNRLPLPRAAALLRPCFPGAGVLPHADPLGATGTDARSWRRRPDWSRAPTAALATCRTAEWPPTSQSARIGPAPSCTTAAPRAPRKCRLNGRVAERAIPFPAPQHAPLLRT